MDARARAARARSGPGRRRPITSGVTPASTTATRPGAAEYGLVRPTEADLLAALARGLGPDGAEALWNRTCAFHGLRRPVTDLSQLAAGAQRALQETEGRSRIGARCFVIKVSNHLAMTKGGAA